MTSPLIHMVAPSPRDYLIANAPSVPQDWFKKSFAAPEWSDELKALSKEVASFGKDVYLRAIMIRSPSVPDQLADSDGPEVRACIEALEKRELLDSEHRLNYERELMAQWPVAWADAVMKARGQ